jgi:carbon-monoxide dehydrogenase large subunit
MLPDAFSPRATAAVYGRGSAAGHRLRLGLSAAATQKVRYVGECIAACIAPTRADAEDLAASQHRLRDFGGVDAASALTATPSVLHEGWSNNLFIERVFQDGNIEEAARIADVVVQRTYRMNRHVAVPLEGRAVLAHCDHRLDELVVYNSTQVPHIIRWDCRRCLASRSAVSA